MSSEQGLENLDLFNQVFGERDRPTRTALGLTEMPLDAAVQIVLADSVE